MKEPAQGTQGSDKNGGTNRMSDSSARMSDSSGKNATAFMAKRGEIAFMANPTRPMDVKHSCHISDVSLGHVNPAIKLGKGGDVKPTVNENSCHISDVSLGHVNPAIKLGNGGDRTSESGSRPLDVKHHKKQLQSKYMEESHQTESDLRATTEVD